MKDWVTTGRKFRRCPIEVCNDTSEPQGRWFARLTISDDTEITTGPLPSQEEAEDALRSDIEDWINPVPAY